MKIERPKPGIRRPEDAKKVFDGVIFDVYQWPQPQYDGSTKTFEIIKRLDTVMVIPVTTEGRILLVDQEQPGKRPFIGTPGGRIDEGEDPLTAIKRELLEETGYSSDEWDLWKAFQPLSKIDWAIYIFIAYNCERTAEQQLDSGEKIKILELSFDEFLDETVKEKFLDLEITMEVLRAKATKGGIKALQQKLLNT
ncbi:MAG: NUDIX hydrolase [Candidatus Dojkabacteria bacterium]